MSDAFLIPTFSDYIRDYIINSRMQPIPGEHHFVAVYLVPRLTSFRGLGIPDYVNPDGMKGIPGDIVFYDRCSPCGNTKSPKLKLGIESKIDSVKFSRTEYNAWMRPAARISLKKPHLFVGIASNGLLIGDWQPFSDRFLKMAYTVAPVILDPKNNSQKYTPSRSLKKIVYDSDDVLQPSEKPLPLGLHWFPYESHQDIAIEREVQFMNVLQARCQQIVSLNLDNHECIKRPDERLEK